MGTAKGRGSGASGAKMPGFHASRDASVYVTGRKMYLASQMLRSVSAVILVWFMCLQGRVCAKDSGAIPASPPQSLDQKAIHLAYIEGEFESVVNAIESFTKANRTYSRSDSVFIAKHLAVIYTANPDTREKGKNYMFRLLDLLPSAKIVDMFVSDEIDRIFEKVREEYVVRQESLGFGAPTKLESNRYAIEKLSAKDPLKAGQNPSSTPKPAAGRKKGISPGMYWIAGGAALAAIGGTLVYLLQDEKPADRVYDLPE